jgi:small subunit ribosomal protein S9
MTALVISQEERKAEIDKLGRSYGTGRRKRSQARVWIKKGNGKITVNDKEISVYFGRPVLRMVINQVFESTNTVGEIDVVCTVKGGGLSGQAGAILHGLARAIDKYNPDFHSVLRKAGFLTRDSRSVERKKPGKAKARKSFQFSKR